MVALTTNQPRSYEIGDANDLPVAAATVIFEGAAVGSNLGYHRPLVAADVFAGFCLYKSDNSAGAAGAAHVHVQQRGRIQLVVTGLLVTDVNALIYASDDNTFSKVALNNSKVGRLVRFVSAGVGIVEFDVSKI